jgi:hypothetical protein
MNPLEYIKSLDHHAYFIHSFTDVVTHLKEYLKSKFQISHTQNPDFYYEKFESFGIDESRALKDKHSSKGYVDGGKRIFIIETSGMTHEAQNALLKIFEEPHVDSHFFLIMPSVEILLPTLKSRLQIGPQSEGKFDPISIKEVEMFLKLSKKDKVAFVDKLAKSISDEEMTKSDAQKFLAVLEIVLYERGVKENADALKAILKSRDYLNDRSASVKQLLEYVAMSV